MKIKYIHTISIGFLAIFLIATVNLSAQEMSQQNSRKVLLRDSLDFQQKNIQFNTNNIEFSPIPYKGGLLYVSNKRIGNQRRVFNKVYWVKVTSIP